MAGTPAIMVAFVPSAIKPIPLVTARNNFTGKSATKVNFSVNKILKKEYTKQYVNLILICLIINSKHLDKCSPGGVYLCRNGGICKYNETQHEVTCFCPDSHEGNYCETGQLCFNFFIGNQ